MPRGNSVRRRPIPVDPVYNDTRVTRFINYIMLDGKKDTARKIFYDALEQAAAKANSDALTMLDQAINMVKPDVEVRPRRVGGATYQIPVPVTKTRGEALAMRWIIDAARARKGRPMSQKLSEELLNAFQGAGDAMTKKENTHKMAEANRAFAHFRW